LGEGGKKRSAGSGRSFYFLSAISDRGNRQTPAPLVPATRFFRLISRHGTAVSSGNPELTAVQLAPLSVDMKTPPFLVAAKRFGPFTASAVTQPPPGFPARTHWAHNQGAEESKIPKLKRMKKSSCFLPLPTLSPSMGRDIEKKWGRAYLSLTIRRGRLGKTGPSPF
jgi:hypothetical protein